MSDLVERVAITITADENTESTNMTRTRIAIAERFKWRPIEHAPKDGTPIIYFDGRHCIGEAFWQDKDEHPPAWWDEANTEEVEPTHWIPLPEPPEEPKP